MTLYFLFWLSVFFTYRVVFVCYVVIFVFYFYKSLQQGPVGHLSWQPEAERSRSLSAGESVCG